MNLKEVREIIALMNENDLAEIEIEREGSKLKLKKSGTDFVQMMPRQAMMPAMPMPAYPAGNPAVGTSDSSVVSSSGKLDIKSPMVGTFYRSPSPDAAAYADAGQIVEVGQVVCIIEAMKLMNEIKSEVRGKVVEVKANNAQPVEYGQVLFTVEPV